LGIIVQRHGAVAEITLDWPEFRNALGPNEGRALRLAIEAADADPAIGAIILSASGKAFCAGGNLPEIVKLAARGADAVRDTIYAEFQGVMRAITQSRAPVIAAVQGPAVGFGCDVALACAATFIGPKGWLAQGWIHAGLVPATGGTLYVSRRAGRQAIFRLLAADRVDGPTAERWNLAIAADDARAAALQMAEKLASFPPAPLEAVVQLSRIDDGDDHLAAALDYQIGFITHPDFSAQAAKLLGRVSVAPISPPAPSGAGGPQAC
jgi:enoyl-CoA hydratase/carnithine racemase